MKPEELIKNQVYFVISYYDSNLTIPEIKTYFYIGTDEIQSDSSLFFQEAEKKFELGSWKKNNDAEEYGIISIDNDCIDGMVCDYTELQSKLAKMKKLHKKPPKWEAPS